MLFIFVIGIVASLIYYGKELMQDKKKLYAFLLISFFAILLGVVYAADPYADSLMELYASFRGVIH